MRSPDLGDPVSLLERRILYFISGTPATQMHIALSQDESSARSNLRANVGMSATRGHEASGLLSPGQGHANRAGLQ
jgi:hypothetical protein